MLRNQKPHQEEPKEVLMNFKLTHTLAEDFKSVCKKEYRNMSAIVRELINNYTQPRK
jgi:hypothetical protein